MTDMKALRAHTRGGPERLVYEAAQRPEPERGEVLIEVHAAGITFAELVWEETWLHLPTIPSHEVSGVVLGLGADVDRFAVGDRVYGLIRFERQGAAAEYVTVPAADLALRPHNVPHTVAAAVSLSGLTAYQALFDHAVVAQGEQVLVHGGAGGVGGYVVQLAAGHGAHVTATAAAKDLELVTSLGAERVIDFQREDFDDRTEFYDVVIDTVGGATLDRSFPVLKRGGRLVTLQAPPSAALAKQYGVTAFFFIVTPAADELSSLAALVESGDLDVTIAETFTLADGRAAYESGALPDRPAGKTILVVRGDGS